MLWLQVPAASDSDSEGDELVQQYLAESGDSDEDALQGLPQWEQPEGGGLMSNIGPELQQLQMGQCTPEPHQPRANLMQLGCTAAASLQTARQPSLRPTYASGPCLTSSLLLSFVAVSMAQHFC